MDPLDPDKRARLYTLVRDSRDLNRDGFASRYGESFLIYGLQADLPNRQPDFKTGYFPSVRRTSLAATQRLPTLMAINAPDPDAPRGIVPIVKSDRNPYTDRISVGRAASCDVVVPILHVSKLHAHFLRNERTHGWDVRDAGSTNGTFVNGRRADTGERLPVKSGDKVHLGSCESRFVDGGGLFDLLISPMGAMLFGG